MRKQLVCNSGADWYQVESEIHHCVLCGNGGLLHESMVEGLLYQRNACCLMWPQTGYKWHLFNRISNSYYRILKKIAYNQLILVLAGGSGIKQRKKHPTRQMGRERSCSL